MSDLPAAPEGVSVRRPRLWPWAVVLFAIVAVTAWLLVPRVLYGPLQGLNHNDPMIVFSIDGTGDDRPGAAVVDVFHHYPVWGQVAIEDPAQRRQIIELMQKGVDDARGTNQYACFWPRHGVRMVRDGGNIDLIICFHCNSLKYHSLSGVVSATTTDAARQTLDEILQQAGVPLVPEG